MVIAHGPFTPHAPRRRTRLHTPGCPRSSRHPALARHLAGGPALFLAHRSGRPTLALTHRCSRYALGPKSTAAPRQRRRTQPTSRPQAAARFPGSGGSGCSPRLHLVQLGARDSKVASSFISSTAAMVASPSFRSAIKVCALKPYQL
jgi:hypothetical protein